MSIFGKDFWLASVERGINTFAQSFLAALIVGGVPTAFADIPLWQVAQVALIATGISIIKSVIVVTAKDGDSVSLTKSAETLR